ncbi:hypothetical protein FHR32_001544 [Streptosporangium album]|uniref:Uncharacterized protein n=1 Tax=Streptosporangium album TaxID=47479 RepID=A0A7W7RS95_9ACTN|nr:hypothetical protein [Streptosporangium album]MBB4937239.1 hypothetical protein [Streptosporangium album]
MTQLLQGKNVIIYGAGGRPAHGPPGLRRHHDGDQRVHPGAAPMMGSTGPADGAAEMFMRYLAAEVGPAGVRVVSLHTAGVVETMSREKAVNVTCGMVVG